MSVHAVALATCLALTSACQEATAPSGPVDREIVLAPEQTVDVDEASVRIRFDGVASDSRCPIDVNCIQAGDAVVLISVLENDESAQYDLHTASPQSVSHGDLTIALVRLLPQPTSTRPIQPDEYRATVRITR
jgi:hypothetical protein